MRHRCAQKRCGRRAKALTCSHVTYNAITTDFWGSLDAMRARRIMVGAADA